MDLIPPKERPDQEPILHPRDMLNLSGALTFSRLGLAIITPFFKYDAWAMLAILLAALLSDLLDGPVARWRGTASPIGAVLDGWIDKIFLVNFAWSMLLADYCQGWHMFAWTVREIIMGITVPVLAWRYYMGDHGGGQPSVAGKASTVFIGVAMFAGLLGVTPVLDAGSAIGGFLGVWASVYYIRRDKPFG